MASLATGDRTATRDEVLAERAALRAAVFRHGLTSPRADRLETVTVHSDAPGHGPLRPFAAEASGLVGVWVNVITDDVPAAQSAAAGL